MRIGYPCINRSLSCHGDRTFRLKSYSEQRLIETVTNNLDCLRRILEFNAKNQILFFRITSDLVPFASHPVCAFPWQGHFRREFRRLGSFIRKHGMRISMHPDQFTLLNSIDPNTFARSVSELAYHAEVLDLMELNAEAKIQIHLGGVYGDKEISLKRFIQRYGQLSRQIRKRLVLENDDRSYTVKDCLMVHGETGVPILLDIFHHRANSSGETLKYALQACGQTWGKRDGIPMVDYSLQKKGGRKGAHAESIHMAEFRRFLRDSEPMDLDIMLEIKDKEKSALLAVEAALRDRRFTSAAPLA